MVVMPVVVEIGVARVIARAAKAGVDFETAMGPRRDTGRTSGKTLVETCRGEPPPSTRYGIFLSSKGASETSTPRTGAQHLSRR